jgi:hypothetical protein
VAPPRRSGGGAETGPGEADTVLERVTLAEIQAVFAVTDALGISREALVIPLAPGRPGRVRRLPNGKLEIVLDAQAPLAEWLEGLPDRIRAAGA